MDKCFSSLTLLSLVLTFGAYQLALFCQKKTGSALCNPILLSGVTVIAVLLLTGTKPEATIYRATLARTGIRGGKQDIDEGCKHVLDEIDVFISECDGQKVSFAKLYNRLMGEEYGARRGVLPIYIANQLVQLQDMPVVYLGENNCLFV